MRPSYKNQTYGNTRRLLLLNTVPLLLGQGILLLIFLILFVPLLNAAFRIARDVAGFSYVTLENLGSFLLHPLSLVMLLLMFFLVGLYLLWEIFFLITYFSQKKRQKRLRAVRLLAASLYRVITGVPKGLVRLVPAAWAVTAACNLPLLFLLAKKSRMLRFVADSVPGRILWAIAGCAIAGLLFVILFRRAFVFQHVLIGNAPRAEAVRQGKNWRRNQPLRTFLYFVGWNVPLCLALAVFYLLVILITVAIVSATFDKNLAIAVFLSIVEKLEPILAVFTGLVCTVSNFAFGTQLFYQYHLAPEEYYVEDMVASGNKGKRGSSKRIVAVALLLFTAVDFIFFVNILVNGSALNTVNLNGVQVTSHRGFSADVPENTIPAIEKAIKEQADFVELDVRMTKDGELVLLHDSNLKRTTGLDAYIWDVNYSELKNLDAGSWMDKGFSWVRIPTLKEVFDTCKGRVYLNLELKYHSPEENLEEKVISLIREHDMQWQCVVTSANLGCLAKIKELEPDIQTGYIAYQLYSGLIGSETVDFFSVKSSLVTRSLVQAIHKSGKLLFVWTVNSKGETERLNRIGVDNIITDNPVFIREVLYQAESDRYLDTLFKILVE